jgi:FeS assembly protein IscX
MRWLDIEDIAENLEEKFPNKDIISLRFTELQKIVLELEDFNDSIGKCNEKILEAIQANWIEIRNEK